MVDDLTVSEKILLCALELDDEKGTFTAEDLVVRCWKRYPNTFGLQGYAETYPDANRVLTNIMGTKGLRGKGWLRKIRQKRYRVTDTGRQAAASRPGGSEPSSERRAASLNRETIDTLQRLTTSRALQKYAVKDDLTFGDLCSFWNVSPRSNAYQLNEAIKATETALTIAAQWLESKAAGVLMLPGTNLQIVGGDLRLMQSLHQHLQRSFVHDLDVIRARSDERLPR